jgi:hypothetical protein
MHGLDTLKCLPPAFLPFNRVRVNEIDTLSTQGCQMVSFQTKKYQFGYILEDLGMENVLIWSGH